jgi:hypothetical protein
VDIPWKGANEILTDMDTARSANSVSGLKEVQINDMYPSPAVPPSSPSISDHPDPGTIDKQ